MNSVMKHPKSDLKRHYTIFLEIGFILSLLVFIALMKVKISFTPQELQLNQESEVVQIEEIVQTEQPEKPPIVPRPQVPVAVPNDEVISEEILDIDAELNIDESLELPSPPSQEEKQEEEEESFFIIVEQMPELVGGLGTISSRIHYPEQARKAGIEGRVIVQFIVNKEGGVENPVVLRGIGGGCDEEALRVVRTLKFKPGRQRGTPVRVRSSLPIVFKLKNSTRNS